MPIEFDQTIIDSSQPNAGRVYDYFIGGNNHFKVDEEMGEKLREQVPFIPKLAKLTRWFLGEAIAKALEEGYTQFLDFASGLPIEDHIHSKAPKGTKVIYSDIDPITVKQAIKIIGENPIVKYLVCNATEPEKLLESGAVKDLFGDNHFAVIGFNGVCWFLTDEQISHTMTVLYEWADRGSLLFLCDGDTSSISNQFKSLITIYKSMNQPLYLRSKQTLSELVKPWTIIDPGFLPLEKWTGVAEQVSKESIDFLGSGAIGGFLKK